MINRPRRLATLAASAVAAVTATVLTTTGAGAAGAVQVYPLDGGATTVVLLDHAETVAASRIGAGNVINQLFGNDRWGVTLEQGSRYANSWYYRPDKGRQWSNVTGQQVIAEAAAHPGGRVALGFTPSTPAHPLWVQQVW